MIHDPKTIGVAIAGGIIPSFIWLWFWLQEDRKKYEPKRLLIFCFVMGMLSVIPILILEKFVQTTISSHNWQIILWAAIEEILKYFAALVVIYRNREVNEPICWPIYLITTALGFAAVENTLFLLHPLALNQATVSLLTGGLRFLGATLLHTVSSGTVGIALGLSLYMDVWKQRSYVFIGLLLAIALHSVFNFFIMSNSGSNFLQIFGFLWVVTIIIMLLFERLRRMSGEY